MSAPAPPSHGFDPEAEQEVDFARYVRLLAVRWWLLAAGIVAGAVIGYLVSLGGSQVYSATATLYLGEPLSSGGSPLNAFSTNPAAVETVITSASVQSVVAHTCRVNAAEFRNGVSSQPVVTTNTQAKTTGTPLVHVTVRTRRATVAGCAANNLTKQAVTKLGSFVHHKIATFHAQITSLNEDIGTIQAAISKPSISVTDKLLLQTTLRGDQASKINLTQLLVQATEVEAPRLVTTAAPQRITATSRRNTVIIAALIGLILGAIAALLWDTVVPRLTPRNGE